MLHFEVRFLTIDLSQTQSKNLHKKSRKTDFSEKGSPLRVKVVKLAYSNPKNSLA